MSTQHDLDFVPDTEFLESGYRESLAEATRELQLVLDPEFFEAVVPRSFLTGTPGSAYVMRRQATPRP